MSWLQNQVNQNPHKLFIQEGDRQYSFVDVGDMAATYSKALLKEGIKTQDRILIYLPSTVEFIEIVLACFEIGAVAVPISQKYTNSELEQIITTIQPKLIITSWNQKLPDSRFPIPVSCIEELPNASSGCSVITNNYKKNIEDVCSIILTSGTTGISNHPVTIKSLVPTMLKRILDLEGGLKALKSLRWILLGGGPSPEYLLDLCIAKKLKIVKVYGMSETCSGTVGLKLLDEPQKKLYAGRPFPSVKIWTENDELHISGPMIMKSYVGEPETDGSHNSHDLGRVDEDNLIFLDIRRKDLIITGGENVNPIEVEEALLQIAGVTDAAVVGVEDAEWGQKVIAFVVNNESRITNKGLRMKLKEQLSDFKIPKEFITVPIIPRNELGKIEYTKLSELQS